MMRDELTEGRLLKKYYEQEREQQRWLEGSSNFPRDITFVDWKTYLAQTSERRGELNAED